MVDSGSGVRTGRSERAAAIDDFAAALRDLRESAGNPSFREMSGRSRAISHTTLHEAAQGNRLPSWATTVEFVKACGADPSDYRARWDDADRQVRGRSAPALEPAAARSPSTELLSPELESLPARETGDVPPHRRPVLLAAAAVVAVGIAVVAIVLAGRDGDPGASKNSGRAQAGNGVGPAAATAQFRSADCPVQQTSPPQAPAAHLGDRARFIGDITVPDCTHVRHDSTFTKIWRLKNAGTVPWRGYVLHRLDLPAQRDSCQTITDVPVAATTPGDFVDIHVEVTAPSSAGFCFVRFRVLDAAGADAFPSGRPINFQVIVD